MVRKLIASAFHNDGHKLTLQYADEKKQFEQTIRENKKASGQVPFKAEHGIKHGNSFIDGFTVAIIREVYQGTDISYAGNKFLIVGSIDPILYGNSEAGEDPSVISAASLLAAFNVFDGALQTDPFAPQPTGAIEPFSMNVNENQNLSTGAITGTVANATGITIDFPMVNYYAGNLKKFGSNLKMISREYWELLWPLANDKFHWANVNNGPVNPSNVIIIYRTDGK